MTFEHAPETRRGFFGTFVQLGSPAGSLLASVAFYLLSISHNSLDGVWRIPFLLSGLLTGCALVIRLRVPESPEFARMKRAGGTVSHPVRLVCTRFRRNLLLSTGALLLGFGGFQIVSIFLILVYAPSVGVSRSTALLAGMILNAVSIATFPLYGWLGDRFGLERMSIIGSAYTIVMAVPMFAMVATGRSALVLLAVPICYAGSNIVFALNSSLVARQFPAEVRTTGVSLSSTVAALVGGALAPLISAELQRLAGGGYWPIAMFLMAQAAISLVCITFLTRVPAPMTDHRAAILPAT
jgi:MFS family permease